MRHGSFPVHVRKLSEAPNLEPAVGEEHAEAVGWFLSVSFSGTASFWHLGAGILLGSTWGASCWPDVALGPTSEGGAGPGASQDSGRCASMFSGDLCSPGASFEETRRSQHGARLSHRANDGDWSG